MRQNANRFRFTREMTCSAILHLAVFCCGFISFLLPKPENPLLVAVEIASEGELKEAIEELNAQQQEKEQPEIEEQKKEPELSRESTLDESGALPTPLEEKNEESSEEKAQENISEEPVPKIEEKKELKKEKKPEKKISKRRNKKAMLDVIKKAEKSKEKKERRKKLQEIAKNEEKKRKAAGDFDNLLSGSINDLKKSVASSGKGAKGSGAGSRGSGNGLSEGDSEAISSQIYPHWAVPSGVKDAENIIIEIRVNLKDSGEVIPSSIRILDEKRYSSDHIFRAAADSARRAILEASPLTIPRDKIDMFRDFVFKFNLKEALST